MENDFKIDVQEWLDNASKNEIDKAFAASIAIAAQGRFITELDDLRAKTVRNYIRGCAWHLAAWFAANWWRLRWEPAIDQQPAGVDWIIAHNLASAGGGYIWPSTTFVSDNVGIEIMTHSNGPAPFEPVRYITSSHARIAAEVFERQVDSFMEMVVARHDALKVKDRSLAELWFEILEERRSPDVAQYRKLEALAGYDPDNAPKDLLRQLNQFQDEFGKTAVEEITGGAQSQAAVELRKISDSRGTQNHLEVSLPELSTPHRQNIDNDLPWQWATKLADEARREWGITTDAVPGDVLNALIGNHLDENDTPADKGLKIPYALRDDSSNKYHVYFNSQRPSTRRFAISRVIGDHLAFAENEKLRPLTRTRTFRQKFQRAFAQEFLCPINLLKEQLGTDQPDDDDIMAAAEHFNVSPLVVKTTLVNKRILGRDVLEAYDPSNQDALS